MKRLWILLISICVFSFAVLGWVGTEIFRQAPPIPTQVVTTGGEVFIPDGAVSDGQNVWQAMGGMQVGSIWGHGSYVAPDWTADYLHREALFILDEWSGGQFTRGSLSSEHQAALKQRLQDLLRTNTYDEATNTIKVDPIRKRAFESNLEHYSQIFTNGSTEYAIQRNAQSDSVKLRKLVSFFFWTSWASTANRPNNTISYTSNFPSEPLVGNVPTSSAIVWTGVSVILLIGAIGGMVWFYAGWHKEVEERETPDQDPLIGEKLTPSQKATVKYFLVVSLLFLLQIVMGMITAHYGVEGGGFYGIPLQDYLPYVVTRTWHTQLGIFWIATAWLAAGLFIAPYICGYEPKMQKLGVDALFFALLIVVLGSMGGQWMSVMHMLGNGDMWFWFGHQGYEYVDLGRVWQAALFIGLLLWLFLIARSAIPALKAEARGRSLVLLYLLTTAGIAFFYAPGLFWGMRSHLTVVEYWRWWVVHLWVEGFFEVFATTVIAFLFARLKVIRADHAAYAALLSGAIYLSGGIIGTLHHLYFAGTPTVALALGSVFSALEIVPLVFVGYEALENIRHSKARPWLSQYKWVVYFFVAVAFWNLVGAGIFGFMINPPIALYYMQGLNTTAVHAHGALYGVYGTLGLALLLFCLRAMQPERKWNTKLLSFAFWAINIGMLMEILFSLLPIGLLQTYQSVNEGYWYARSPEFMQTSLMQTLRWMRLFGDTVFAIGAIAFVWFAVELMIRKQEPEPALVAEPAEA
ncbi:MAG TPA: nitric-oxide reductase large subunit [Pyrinomonadaceae bacterium]